MSDTGPSQEPEEASEHDPLVGTVIAGRYRVDERLGVGGMGAVYRAEHVLMKKPVAVKVLHREMTVLDEVVKRFEREAIAAGRIDHPNVTVATDFGKLEDGSFYLVLEYVPGRSLTKALEEDGAFSAERALFITRQVAAALGAAHAAHIVHRDLKPDNIMLIERGGTRDFVKVLDFGIAKVNAPGEGGSQLTRVGSVFGTPAYMSPEQAAGKPVDHRADLYALGLVTYEMLAGKPAFASAEIVGLLTKQLIEPPPPLPPSVPPEVAALVMKLLEKDPDLRIQTAAEIVLAIDALLGPAALPPDSTVLGVASVRGGPPSAPGPLSARHAVAAESSPSPLSRVSELASDLVRRVSSGETVRIAGRDVPRSLLGVAAGAAVLGAILTVGFVRTGKHPVPAAASAEVSAPAPELTALLLRAQDGDPIAIEKLEARPEKGRTSAEWAAIGKGRIKLADYRRGLEAMRSAVSLDSSLASDHDLLRAVRRVMDDEAMQKAAMEFAAVSLGDGGADVLFDVWASTSEKTEATSLAKSFLERDDVRNHASVALRVALDLRRTSRCEEVKRLVAVAKESADERAFRPLNQLNSRKGCGFLRLSDCFPCLRGGDDLAEALKATQQRKGPRF